MDEVDCFNANGLTGIVKVCGSADMTICSGGNETKLSEEGVMIDLEGYKKFQIKTTGSAGKYTIMLA